MAEYADVPEGFQVATSNGQHSDIPQGFSVAPKTRTEGAFRRFIDNWLPIGAAETALNMGTGMIATPINEFIAAGVNAVPGGANAADVMADPPVGTYQPRTQSGQKMTAALNTAMSPVSAAVDFVANPTGNEEYATGEHLVKGALGLLPFARRGARTAPRPAQAAPASGASAPSSAAQAAQSYVVNIGLQWDRLPRAMQAQLTEIAKDARALNNLDPESVKRQALVESLPVPAPATRGQLTRDSVQLRNEGNVSATTAGKPIRDIYVAQNAAILQNLEVLRGRTGGRAASAEQVGQSVQGAARAKLENQRKVVRDLYRQAEDAGELQGTATTRPLARLIEEAPDLQHLGWVDTWLNKAGIVTDQVGRDMKGLRLTATLKELEDLRQAAVARAMNGGTDGYYAGKVIKAIDESTEGVGGQAYARARAARRQQALEFEDQSGVASLVENRSRTDRAIALEDTWRRTVLGGSIADLAAVKRSLLTGGNASTRTSGRQAWRDLQAQTIQEITNRATRSVARFEDGSPNVTPAALEQSLKAIGPEKLEMVFGSGTVRRLNDIMEATRIAKTEPPPGFKGSPTFANTITFLESLLNKVPALGDSVTGTIRAVSQVKQLGEAGRVVSSAKSTPLGNALSEAGSRQRSNARNHLLQRGGMIAPAAANALDADGRPIINALR